MATVATDIEPICYLLPEAIQEWATSYFLLAQMDTNLFPAQIVFIKTLDSIYAEVK